jgi:arginase
MPAIIAAPYHLGHRGRSVGAGPLRLLELGVVARLASSVTTIDLGPQTSWQNVNLGITAAVSRANTAGAFPLVLAGNCNSCLGTLAAIEHLHPGIVWFDAHGDFHTEATSISGSVEGMSLALATERFVPETRVVLAGARDLDPGEIERVNERLRYSKSGDLAAGFLPDFDNLYVHLDIDVLDPSISPGANFQGPGGMTLRQLRDALQFVFTRYNVAALAITNYNPDRDPQNRTRDIIAVLIQSIADLRKTSPSR